MAVRRVRKEEASFLKDNENWNVSFGGDPTNPLVWRGIILGPQGSLYEDCIFEAQITFPPEYPFKPFKFSFNSPIVHPNFSAKGAHCCTVCKLTIAHWSPGLTVLRIIPELYRLLTEPQFTGCVLQTKLQKLHTLSSEEYEAYVKKQMRYFSVHDKLPADHATSLEALIAQLEERRYKLATWTPKTHRYFPQSFRENIILMLLIRNRSQDTWAQLPFELLQIIIQHCVEISALDLFTAKRAEADQASGS